METKKVVVVNVEQSDKQLIYVDGDLRADPDTAYAFDIIDAVGGSDIPFTLEFRSDAESKLPQLSELMGLE